MRRFCPLASGSSGNAIYLETNKSKILFDAGISFKQLEKRLGEIGVNVNEIDAIVISHEHSDHTKGLEMVVKKLNIPVFCNSDTANAICQSMAVKPKLKIFLTGEDFHFNDVEIHPFSIQHDTADPVGFTVKFDDLKIGICTDVGFITKSVENHLKWCDYLYLEANHDEDMVHSSSRPMIYKNRVLSRQGHLSNHSCGELLFNILHDKLKHVYLAHLSKECNTPEVAIRTVRNFLNNDLSISVAHPDKISHQIIFI